MRYRTSRFGNLEIDSEGILLFPDGLIGHEELRHFVLLSESRNPNVGWLQSLRDPEFAVAAVTPHRFVPKYSLKLHRSELSSLPWSPEDRSVLLAIASKHENLFTINLKAPVIINLDRCLGRQVMTADDQPVRYALPVEPALLRKIA